MSCANTGLHSSVRIHQRGERENLMAGAGTKPAPAAPAVTDSTGTPARSVGISQANTQSID